MILACNSVLCAQQKEQLEEVFRRMKSAADSTRTFSYRVERVDINPNLTDSVNILSGEVWLKVVPLDTIFGCHFHVKGRDKEPFDYYYDGQRCYEIRPNQKSINIFNPFAFPNDVHNPAKARTSVLLFVSLLIDRDISSTLMKGNPKVIVASHQFLKLRYPPNEYGQKSEKEFRFSKGGRILRIADVLLWRGTTFTTRIEITSQALNSEEILDSVYLTWRQEGYSIREIPDNVDHELNAPMLEIGKDAPDFAYPAISGKKISLSSFSGKVVLLDFWESWCGYCILAFPKLIALEHKFRNEGLVVIGVTTENADKVKKVIAANKIGYNNVLADKKILAIYKVSSWPTYVLIGKDGRISKVSYGDLIVIDSALTEILRQD